MTDEDLPQLHVGDHVSDLEDDDRAPMVVTGTPPRTADETRVDSDKTVADYNPDYPEDDDVIEVVFPSRTDVDLSSRREYSYPRGRLKLETPLHDRSEEAGHDE